MLNALIQDVVTQLQQILTCYLQLEKAELGWDPVVLTEALVIFLFTLNQDIRLENTSHHSQQQDKLAFILLSKVFKLSYGIASSTSSGAHLYP